MPPDVPQYFAPGSGDTWVPMLVGAARVSYADAKLGLDETSDVVMWTPLTEGPVTVDWEHAEPAAFGIDALLREPAAGGSYTPLAPVTILFAPEAEEDFAAVVGYLRIATRRLPARSASASSRSSTSWRPSSSMAARPRSAPVTSYRAGPCRRCESTTSAGLVRSGS